MTEQDWRVILGAAAEKDFRQIIIFTRVDFGPRRAAIYENSILQALAELSSGPEARRSHARDDLRPGMRSLRVARGRRRGRHVIFYRVADDRTIQIVRILHDAMNFAQHVHSETD